MKTLFTPIENKEAILSLGAESAGNFSVYKNGKIYFSQDFGDLLNETNFINFQKNVLVFLKQKKTKPTVIITDLHPLYKTTTWGIDLAKKYTAKHIQIQHHHAHIFSAIGEKMPQTINYELPTNISVALDGTGYGLDGKIWGGEIFKIKNQKSKIKIERVGHLENQTMIGGELAIKEPARILLAILAKFKNYDLRFKNNKIFVFNYLKKYYSKNQLELLWSQLEQNFNCQETSSAGRILDAVSILLGFARNERKHKHEAIDLLEKNSTIPYNDLQPKITKYSTKSHTANYTLQTTHLFKYLIKNLHKDRKRLATTAQLYIAQGIDKIIKNQESRIKNQEIYLSGGVSNNRIISSYLKSKKYITNKKIPRGDAGLSFGQIVCHLLDYQ